MRHFLRAALIVVIAFAPRSASAELTGSWSGSYVQTLRCDTGATLHSSGVASASLSESGGIVAGALTVDAFPFDDAETCTPGLIAPVSFLLDGVANGASFSGTMRLPSLQFAVSGTISGSQFVLTVTSASVNGTFTLVKDTPFPVSLTGTWRGELGGVHACDDDVIPLSGPVTAWLRQNGDRLIGTAVANTIYVDSVTCGVEGPMPMAFGVSATIENNSLRGVLTTVFGDKPLFGALNGAVLRAAGADEEVSVTTRLTRTELATPSSTYSGTWSGSAGTTEYVGWGCKNMSFISYTESLSLQLLQLGDAVIGSGTARGGKSAIGNAKRECRIVDDPPQSFTFAGALDGAVLRGAFVFDDEPWDFEGSISGNTFTGAGGDTFGVESAFTVSRQSANEGPIITTFAASAPSVTAGEAVTLSWCTANAASVSIDQGIGAQPLNGSFVVHPAVTTTYVLTASNGIASSTAHRTIEVVAPARRRTVRK